LIRDGLKPGERVVTAGFQKISAGMQVKPIDANPPADQAELKPRDADESEAAPAQSVSQVR
ncbi:efflux transporter periplasmic adaptor subunit, partial [Methylobacterium oxalidis]